MLTFDHVTKRYGDRSVLEDFTYAFPERGVVAVTGPSGCGKTTLLRLAAGLEKPDRGSVRYTGTGRSMVFQEPRLFPHLTVAENLALVLTASGQGNAQANDARATAPDWLDKVGLSDARDLYPAALSGGMKQRLALARALAFPADLLLLDEPFSNLDAARKAELYPLLRDQAASRLILLVSHAPDEVEALADRVLTWEEITAGTR